MCRAFSIPMMVEVLPVPGGPAVREEERRGGEELTCAVR
jgi:hypothetical protein